jgi:hypothetical protein
MMKNSLTVFLCLLLPFSFAAKAGMKQDTVSTSGMLVDSTHLRDTLQRLDDFVPTVTLEDVETNDESGSDQGISPVLSAGRDPFVSAASFNWSIARFRVRGYDNDYYETYMNGIPTEYIDNGFSSYNLWSGLNDVTRSRETSLGLKPTTFSYGSIGGVYSIDSRAAKQRKQLSVTIGTSNRTYDLRGGITYGSGISKKGWSFAGSLFGRWAKNGYVKGTALQSLSYFFSVQKMFKNQSLALTAFGVPTKQGKASATTQEAYDLAGSNYYNPNWGYQEGKVRNARVEYRHQPVFILTHEWKPKETMSLMSSLGYSFGERSVSNFDRGYSSDDDPRPDYYKYLPSYYSDAGMEAAYKKVYDAIKADPNILQVDWAKLYGANLNSPDTTINGVTGKKAHYILGDDVSMHQRINFNTVYNVSLKHNFDITAGFMYQYQKTNQFKRVNDLLGADFYHDVDRYLLNDSAFYDPSIAYADLNNPDRVVKEGDKYGYNYDEVVNKASVWGQVNQHLKHFDWFVAGEYSNSRQWRVGHFKPGVNPDNSEGKSRVISSNNFDVKGGITYKINGRNYIYANGSYGTRAPYWTKLFISPRLSNETNDDVKGETIGSVEAGYIFVSPKIKLKASGYYTNFRNGSNTIVFFDDFYFGLGNYNITNINKVHYGGELGAEAQIYKGLSASLAVAAGNYKYTSRQLGTLTVDAQPDLLVREVIYSRNFKVANTPMQAYSLGLNYRSKKFWYVGITVNFFDQMYTDFAPTHRTDRATDNVTYQSDQWYSIINQERINKKGQWTLDMSGGYSWRLKSTFKKMNGKNSGKYYLVLNAGLSNITNNTKFLVSGREQLRYDYNDRNPNTFPAKYSYAYGINFYANLTFRM